MFPLLYLLPIHLLFLAKRSSHYQKGATSKNIHESGGSFSFTFSFKLDHTPPIKYIVATKRKVTCNTYSVLPEYILKTFLFASHVFKRQTHTVWGNFIDAKSSLWFFIQPNQEVFFPCLDINCESCIYKTALSELVQRREKCPNMCYCSFIMEMTDR